MSKVKALIYCCKNGETLLNLPKNDEDVKKGFRYSLVSKKDLKKADFTDYILNGKIVCECEVETEEIVDKVSYFDSWFNEGHHTKTLSNNELKKRSCLSYQDLYKYLGGGEPNEVVGYALHLSNVKEKVMELSDVYSIKDIGGGLLVTEPLKKAPQNMMWGYVYENGYWVKYLLISVRPQWLCKILNKQKDIEVRRKVLKGMCE